MKALNKNFKIVKVNKGVVVIPIIAAPKYFINNIELTEYDVRNIQLEVALGNIDYNIANELQIKDENNLVLKFREDGKLENSPKGYNILSDMVLKMLRINK